jgi:cation transport ATPase
MLKERVMALIKCNECRKDVSTKAISCPNCGNPTTATNAIEDTTGKVLTPETSNEMHFQTPTVEWGTDLKKEQANEENVALMNQHKRKYRVSVGVCLATLAMLVSLADQITGNVWNGENPFIAFVAAIYFISFFLAIVYNIKHRSAKRKVDGTIKKGRRGLYWISIIWIAITATQAGKLVQNSSYQLKLSSILIIMFLPVLILWGIPVLIKNFKKPKTERPIKGLISWKTDKALIIWGNLAFWFLLVVQFLRFRGM